ncbi:MAG: RNA polymerase sigma factor [Planctomycetes bacterium]|nr:RNA polymerase sigma factor [Planctomycetota bacterium]
MREDDRIAPELTETSPEASTELRLVEHVEWLRRVARALVADAGAGDDAVQETCLAALQRPPRPGPTVRAWLKRVLLRGLNRERVVRSRRAKRERAAAHEEAVPSAHAIAERMDLESQIARAVAALPETQRVVLFMRFWEQAPPRVIARRLELPVETVRTRLKRALAALREKLERAHGSEWRVALLPLAGATVEALTTPVGIAATSSLAFATGALAMKTKLAIGIVVIALGGCFGAWLFAPDWFDLAEELQGSTENRLTAHMPAVEGEPLLHAVESREERSAVSAEGLSVPALRLRVIDAAGAPVAGIEVAVRPLTPKGVPLQPIWKMRCDTDGRASWQEAAATLGQSERALEATVLGFVGSLTPAPLSKELDLGAEVLLQLPPCGRVLLRVVDPEGRPGREGYATLRSAVEESNDASSSLRASSDLVPIRDGCSEFRYVQLGIPLQATAHPVACLDGSIELEPLREADEFREAEMRFDRGLRSLKLRLTRARGEPLARAFFTMEVTSVHGRQSTGGTSGSAGELYLRVTGPTEQGQELEIQVRAPDYGSGATKVAYPLADGLFDAGELRLAEDPLALAGIAMIDGQGTERMAVHFRFLGQDEALLEDPRPFNTWSKAGGHFSYRVEAPAFAKVAFVEARIDSGARQSPWARFAPGTREVVLSATHGKRLEIRPLPSELVQFAHHFSLSSRKLGLTRPIFGRAEGEKIVFGGLLPGTYELQVRSSPVMTESFAELEGIEVRPDQAPSDPRLDPLDLRAHLTCFGFDLVLPEGREGRNAYVDWRRSGDTDAKWQTDQFHRKLHLLVSPPGPIDLVIRVPGTRALHLERVEQGRELHLQPGLSVILGLEPNPSLPPGCRSVWAHLELIDEARPELRVQERVRLDDLLGQRFEIGSPGRYRVRWSLEVHEQSDSSTLTSYRGVESPQEIEILDLPGEQRFQLPMPPR